MKIYIEIVFISNFFIDLFLIVFTLAVLKKKAKTVRVIISALLGGLFSVVYPLCGIYKYFLKCLCAVIMTAVAGSYKKFGEFIAVLLTFCATTFILGGLITFFLGFAGDRFTYNDFTYGLIPILISSSCIGIIFFVDLLFKEVGKVRHKNLLYYDVLLKSGNYSKKCRAFYDSGNRVYANNGEPVIFVKEKIYNVLARESGNCGYVDIVTAVGIKSVPICIADIEIYFADGTNIIYKVFVGKLTAPCEAEILLHSDMIGEMV